MESLRQEEGQGLIEYVLLLVLITTIVIAVLRLVGPVAGSVFSNIVASVSGTSPIPPPLCYSTRLPLGGPAVDVGLQITSPRHCDTNLATTMTVSGTYTGDLTGKEIWILVYPTDLEYYPQPPDVCQPVSVNTSAGAWSTTVNFGGPLQQYDLIAVVTDTASEAGIEFRAWMQHGCETSDLPGYLRVDLPSGLTEITAITVSTAAEITTQPPAPLPEECSFEDSPSRTPIAGPFVGVEIEITSPQACTKGLTTSIAVGGSYTGNLTGKEIWLLVYPTNGRYYPQTVDPCRQLSVDAADGLWNTRANFGGPPQPYDLVAVVIDTDSTASQAFKQWLQHGCETQEYVGYAPDDLPSGLTEVAAVTVSTADE